MPLKFSCNKFEITIKQGVSDIEIIMRFGTKFKLSVDLTAY